MTTGSGMHECGVAIDVFSVDASLLEYAGGDSHMTELSGHHQRAETALGITRRVKRDLKADEKVDNHGVASTDCEVRRGATVGICRFFHVEALTVTDDLDEQFFRHTLGADGCV